MMLHHVTICENKTAQQCEDIINQALVDYPDKGVDYQILIENSVRIGNISDNRYTLLLNISEKEET